MVYPVYTNNIVGCGGTFVGWLNQAKFLSERGYQVCIFDNRGIGKSSKIHVNDNSIACY
jgi:predicted alpha/beta hydrolase